MSIVLDALNKAQNNNDADLMGKQGEKRINEIKYTYQKSIKFIVLMNIVLLSLILCFFIFRNLTQRAGKIINLKQVQPAVVEQKKLIETPIKEKIEEIPPPVQKELITTLPKLTEPLIKKNYIQFDSDFEIKISGIIHDQTDSYILIDSYTYKIGETINKSVLLKSINKRSIELEYKGKLYEIPT